MKSSYLPFIVVLILLIGCSSNAFKTSEPTSPMLNESSNLSVGVIDRFPDGSTSGGFGALGIFSLELKPSEGIANLNPLRTSALTDTLEVVDITNFLTMAPCTNCAKIKSVALDNDNNFVVTIGIRHPFDVGDPLKPITGRNRADLHVFNIEGIIATQGAATNSFPSLGMTLSAVNLKNASGYTSYLDDVLDTDVFQTDANAHPYILHFADYSIGNFDPINPMGFASVTDPPPSGNLVMTMGCDYDYRDYVFNINEDVSLIYAIGCTYAVSSASKSQRFTPEYRIPQHMKKAASEVIPIPPTEKLKYTTPTDTVTFQVHVVDPSHGVAVGSALNEMLADSSVSQVSVEIPDVLASPATQPGNASISGTGHDPSDPLVYEFTISNEMTAPEGIYPALVKVSDTYTPGLNTSPLLNGMDGIKRVDPIANPLTGLFDIHEFATYATFTVEVELGYVGTPPNADLTRGATGCAPVDVSLDASGSTDAEDPLADLWFEFDYDFDGINFTIDRAMSHDPTALASYPARGCYTAAVRVTDTDNESDIATVIVPVGGFEMGPTENDITDGIQITSIDFMHGIDSQNVGPTDIGQRPKATKGLARGDGYIYIVFMGTQGGSRRIFFSRSSDEGDTWDTPVVLHTYDAQGEYGGCSIAADDSGLVYVIWCDWYHRDLIIEYSYDNGTTFNTGTVRNLADPTGSSWSNIYHQPDVVFNPNDTNNIFVSVQPRVLANSGTLWIGWNNFAGYHSTTGPAGPFMEVINSASTSNGYNLQSHYLADGDVYMIFGCNVGVYVLKSSDGGATWPDDAEHRDFSYRPGTPPTQGWHRETSSAFDPNDTETFYVVEVRRSYYYNHPIHIAKATDGLHLVELHWNINDNTSMSYYRFNPSVTVNDAGAVYVMWQTNQFGDFDIMADYSCDGGVTFHTDVVFNAVNNGNEIDPFVIPDLCGDGAICVWEQNGFNASGKLVVRKG